MRCTAMKKETPTIETIQEHELEKGKLYEVTPNDQYGVKYMGKFEFETEHILFFLTKGKFYVTVTKVNHFLGHEKIKEVTQ